MGHLAEIKALFMLHQNPLLPVAVVQNGTLPQEKSILGNLSNIEDLVKDHNISSPALIIIGWAAAKAMSQNSPLNTSGLKEISWVA